jgi:hypothetical protein
VAKLDKLTEEEMRETGLPGLAIAVIFKDRVAYAKGFGVREVGRRGLVGPDTVFSSLRYRNPWDPRPIPASLIWVLQPSFTSFPLRSWLLNLT